MTDTLVQYVHNKQRTNLIGAMVACLQSDGDVYVGWSLTHSKSDRKKPFDKRRALQIAVTRAEPDIQNDRVNNQNFPTCLKGEANKFAARAAKYFKVDRVHIHRIGEVAIVG